MTDRKRLVYGRKPTRDRIIQEYQASGWRLCMVKTEYWPNGKKIYIAELEKPTL